MDFALVIKVFIGYGGAAGKGGGVVTDYHGAEKGNPVITKTGGWFIFIPRPPHPAFVV